MLQSLFIGDLNIFHPNFPIFYSNPCCMPAGKSTGKVGYQIDDVSKDKQADVFSDPKPSRVEAPRRRLRIPGAPSIDMSDPLISNMGGRISPDPEMDNFENGRSKMPVSNLKPKDDVLGAAESHTGAPLRPPPFLTPLNRMSLPVLPPLSRGNALPPLEPIKKKK